MADILKYSKALEVFRDTDLTRKEIYQRCKLNVSAFNAYLRRHHKNAF